MLRSAEDLDRLPVRRHEHAPVCAPEFLSVSAGLQFSISDEQFSALGFGCSRQEEKANSSALWETYERLLMVAELSGSLGRPVEGRSKGGTQADSRPFQHIVPRPWHDTYREGQDATGLAIHTTGVAAERAAERELTERALLAALWYGTTPIRSEAADHNFVTTGRLRTYSFPCHLGYFSLAAWHDPRSQILVAGSAVRDSLDEAIEHAAGEAVMVFDGVWQGRTPRYSTHTSRDRYASLRGDLHTARAEHLETRLTGGRGSVSYPLDVADDDMVFYRLIDWEDVCLVRAVSGRLPTPGTLRSRVGEVPADPFT
ncbi:hypothetical protein [Streptomyces luteolus]|uniref:YcaO domain-containing protein n=1 Tax=Streptomyces luteolus TaxID=3043615 RepID=A0ABT6SYF7_9ACTN|nr:hypothetical protein [Streptomyces sp. B-S-A12]MDI3420436.1 hypothetical protein [Streptomyces sp. B-S-A12]